MSKDEDRYCQKCGKKLIHKEHPLRQYHPGTGRELVNHSYTCPDYRKKFIGDNGHAYYIFADDFLQVREG